MIERIYSRMGNAVKLGAGCRLSFVEASMLLSDREQVRMSVGGTPGERALAAILATALGFTRDQKILVSIGSLLLADVTVSLADESDKPLMEKNRTGMLRAGVYPSNANVLDVLRWLDLLDGHELPFHPYDSQYVEALLRTAVKWMPKKQG